MVVIVYCNCILWQKENVSNYLECLGIALKYISNFFSEWWKWWKELIFFFFLRCCLLYSVNHKTIIVNSLIYLKPEGWHLRSMDCVSAWSLTQERREYFSAVPHKRETSYFLQLDWFFFLVSYWYDFDSTQIWKSTIHSSLVLEKELSCISWFSFMICHNLLSQQSWGQSHMVQTSLRVAFKRKDYPLVFIYPLFYKVSPNGVISN